MAQTKDLKPADVKKPLDRFPNWLLFLISALAIFFSPFGFFGAFVIGFSSVVNNNLLYRTIEAIFFVVGFVPLATLGDRREYFLVILLLTFAIINIGFFGFIYMLSSLLADPTLGG
jgi:hypothetical protein